MLLAHNSGLPAYEKLFLRVTLVPTFCKPPSHPLTADPGTRAEYSDIGFIILASRWNASPTNLSAVLPA